MAATDIGARLQHPRRSLGNRHRSQANKFLKLAGSDKNNLPWAEQSARQAVLHDFCVELLRNQNVCDTTYEAAVKHFSERESST